MAMAFAIIGDVVSPRERGRYSGYLGAVFALAGVAGPLLGGYFVDNLSWRWMFYVNLPVGLVALVVTSSVLRLPFATRRHRVDLEGAALLVVVPGPHLHGELDARLPHRLRQVRRHRLLPLFLQVVTGASATNSGLLLLPLMAGLMATSLGSGRVITRTGRYRAWPGRQLLPLHGRRRHRGGRRAHCCSPGDGDRPRQPAGVGVAAISTERLSSFGFVWLAESASHPYHPLRRHWAAIRGW
jgi:predicted MFS family arabinose efflux permease